MENIQSFVSSLFNNNSPSTINNSHTTNTTNDSRTRSTTTNTNSNNSNNGSTHHNHSNSNDTSNTTTSTTTTTNSSLSSSASDLLHAFQTALWNGGIAPPDFLSANGNRHGQQENQDDNDNYVTEQFIHHQQQAQQRAQNQQHPHAHNQQHHHQSSQSKIPPISKTILEHLPTVTMTKDDLIDPMNRQCTICFNDIILGQMNVIRLIPYCGHTFCCKDCIVPWLQKSATCPICRYELPTSAGYQYEVERKERMKLRKPRLAKYELYRMSTSQLQDIIWMNDQPFNSCSSNPIPHFVEKQDIIDYIISSNDLYVDWIIPSDPVKYTVSQLQLMSISQLKNVMNNEAGLFYDKNDNILEKDDMLRYFLVSGRLEIIPEIEVKTNDTEETTSSSGVIVETVIDENENNEDNNNDNDIMKNHSEESDVSTTILIDTRSDPTVLMEENISFHNNNNNVNNLNCGNEENNNNNNNPIVILNNDDDALNYSTQQAASVSDDRQTDDPHTGSIHQNESCTDTTIAIEENVYVQHDVDNISNDNKPLHSLGCCLDEEQQQQQDHDDTTTYQNNNISTEEEMMMDIEYEMENNSNPLNNDNMLDVEEDNRSINSLLEDNNVEMMNDLHSNDEHNQEEQTDDSINNDATTIRVTGSEYNNGTTAVVNDSNNDNATIRVIGSFQDRSLTDLKALAKELNINLIGCLERNDIIERIINHISKTTTTTNDNGNTNNNCHRVNTTTTEQQQRRPAGFAVASNNDINNNFDLSLLQSDIFGITELRMITEILHIDTSQCLMTCKDSIVIAIYEAAMNDDRSYIIQCLQSLKPLVSKKKCMITVSLLRYIAKEWNINISDCIEKNEMIQKLIVYKIHSML